MAKSEGNWVNRGWLVGVVGFTLIVLPAGEKRAIKQYRCANRNTTSFESSTGHFQCVFYQCRLQMPILIITH